MSDGLTSRRVEGIDLVVREGDAARTVVLLHGIGGRASSFAEVMMRWPPGARLIAWDQPGYGKSAPHPAAWPTPADYGAVLARVLDGLGVAAVDLLGQSLGALIAATFASKFPVRVKRLVLASPAHGYGVPVGGPLTPALAQRLADFQREGAAVFAAKRAPRLVFDSERHAAVTAIVRENMATLTESGHAQAVKALASGDIASALRATEHDVLFMSGADDVITPMSGTRALFELCAARACSTIVSERMVFVPRAGHAVYLENPQWLTRTAAEYLEGRA